MEPGKYINIYVNDTVHMYITKYRVHLGVAVTQMQGKLIENFIAKHDICIF